MQISLTLHKGETPLPKPIQKLPKAVFYFAQKYSNIHGEWLWDISMAMFGGRFTMIPVPGELGHPILWPVAHVQ